MKKTLLALALLASAATAFANDGTKPTAKAAAKKDHCTGAAAVKCEKGMTATASMEGMPACCRAKMAAAKAAAAPATAEAKPVVKAL